MNLYRAFHSLVTGEATSFEGTLDPFEPTLHSLISGKVIAIERRTDALGESSLYARVASWSAQAQLRSDIQGCTWVRI